VINAIDKRQVNIQMAILVFGIAEICIGLLGAMAADFISIFNLLVLFSGIAGIIGALFCIFYPNHTKIYDILAVALMLAYGTGTLNSLVSYALDNKDLLSTSSVAEYWLSRTLGLATTAAGFLHIVGRFDTKGYMFVQLDMIDFQVKRTMWFVGLVFLVAVIFIATGKLGFMADLAAVEGYVSISASSAILLDLMTPAGAIALYLGRRLEHRNKKIFFISLAVILLVIQFGLGRRIFVFSLLIYMIVAVLAKRPEKIFSTKNIVILIVIAMLIQVATSTFFIMRVAGYAFKNTQKKPSIVQLVPEAIKVYKDRERLYIAEQIHENLSSRTFVLEYLAALSEKSTIIKPLLGKNLERALVVATPSIIYWSKYKNPLFIDEENLLNPHFRLPVTDNANTVLTASVGDFGEIGLFILPVFICVVFSLLMRLTQKLAPAITYMLILIFVCKTLLSVEQDIVTYITAMRSIFIILIISWFIFESKETLRKSLIEKDYSMTAINNQS
jgi:hypothetical protein